MKSGGDYDWNRIYDLRAASATVLASLLSIVWTYNGSCIDKQTDGTEIACLTQC